MPPPMARPQSPPILAQLRTARTLPEQTAALRSLKNEIVGHVQKKETWISLGVLDPIVRTLSTASPRSSSKMNGKEARLPVLQRPLSEDENVRLQALQLVASFANGGPMFLAPLHAARILPALLANLSPFTNPPQLVVASLKALTDISNAAALAAPSTPLSIEALADSIFSAQYLDSFSAMLSFSTADPLRQSQVTLAAGLISRLCHEERHQHTLTMSGILDALSTRLASFAVARGQVIPGAFSAAHNDGIVEAFPDPAPSNAQITPILLAISMIIGDSQYRAYRLVNSPSILAVFPSIKFDPTNELLDSMEYGGFGSLKQHPLTAMEYLLPTAAPITISRNFSATHQGAYQPRLLSDSQASSRTSLNKLSSASVWESMRFQTASPNGDADTEEVESPFIPWLVYLVRTSEQYERLLAASVLATVVKAGLGSKGLREASVGLLVVPPLVGLMERADADLAELDAPEDATKRAILEQAPAVLARLILDSEYLQKAAFDSDAVVVLSAILKHAYEPTSDGPPPRYWSPNPDTGMDVENASPLAQLGEEGQSALLLHRIRVRESSLKAIAALAGGREDYRKAFVDADILPCVVESLSEFPRKPQPPKERAAERANNEGTKPSMSHGYGVNPVSVLIAGCHTIRMLSRSVNILRTTLVDNGTAMPILGFLKHPDINLQIAAAAAMANLLLEVSPVREPLTEQGVMKILCEHAHSQNAALRLNAIWALKHFVDAVSSDLKKACLHELRSDWLINMVCDDMEDSALQGQQRREMSGGFDLDDDVDMQPSDEPHRWMYGSNGVLRELDSTHSTKLRQAEDKLAAVREAELNPVRRARNDDMAIQEQALNFIRNLIGRPEQGTIVSGESTAMINYLLGDLGEGPLFEMLTSKLRTKVLHPFSRRSPVTGRETRVVHPQAKIVAAVTYILVHMAASVPRHRQIVIAQTELLKLLAQQSSSKDKEVRLALCHLILNLTCKETEGEAEGCETRTHELRKLGYHTKMETLKNQDVDLDVRERAKAAAYQMQAALK